MQTEKKAEKSKASRQKPSRKKKHGMDTERETEASVVGANAQCER